MSIRSTAKRYAEARTPQVQAESSSSSERKTPIEFTVAMLKHSEREITQANYESFERRFAKCFGKNIHSRADKNDRSKSITDEHGKEVRQVLFAIRQLIPFFALSRPTMRYQKDFIDYISNMVCGTFFAKKGLLVPGFWGDLYTNNAPMGKSGTFANNNWKAFTEAAPRIWNVLHSELLNPTMQGTGICSKYSLSLSMCNDHTTLYYDEQVKKRGKILSILNIEGFEDNALVFSPSSSSSTGSLLIDFIEKMGIISDDNWTVGYIIFIY